MRISCRFFVTWLLMSNVVIVLWVGTVFKDGNNSDDIVPWVPPSDNFRLASEQSYGFLDDIPRDEWIEFYQIHARSYAPYRNVQRPDENSDRPPYWVFHNWDPYFSCPRLRRVASTYVCDPHRILQGSSTTRRDHGGDQQSSPLALKNSPPPCLVYAFVGGKHGQDSIDEHPWISQTAQFFGTKCQIHVFGTSESSSPSSSPSSSQYAIEHVIYHNWNSDVKIDYGMNQQRQQRQRQPLQETMKQLGHGHRTIDLLFMDCEGCEWYVYDEILALRPRQILLQTHDLPLRDRSKETIKYGILPPMAASHFFDTFRTHGYVLFAKRVLSATEECSETDWSFLRLSPSFLLSS